MPNTKCTCSSSINPQGKEEPKLFPWQITLVISFKSSLQTISSCINRASFPWSTILTQWNLSKRKLRKGNMCRPCVLSLMKNRHLLLFYSVVKRILRQWSKDCNSHRLVLEKLAKMSEWLWRNVTRIFMLSAHFQTPLYTRPSLKPSLFHLACFLLWVQLLQQPHS